METQIQQWGNSLAVRLPKTVTRIAKLHRGSMVRIVSKANSIVIKAEKQVRQKTLDELLVGIAKKNKHKLFDWGDPVGKEIW